MPKKDYIIKDFSGGMVLDKHSTSLEDNEASMMDNLKSDTKGILSAGVDPSIVNGTGGSYSISGCYIDPGYGLYHPRFDYFDYKNGQTYFNNMDTIASVSPPTITAAGTTITAVDNQGIVYNAGGVTWGDAHVKINQNSVEFRPDRWYLINMQFINQTRTALTAWPGSLSCIISDSDPTTLTSAASMYPKDYQDGSFIIF